MLHRSEIDFTPESNHIADRADGYKVYQVGTAKQDKSPVVVVTKEDPESSTEFLPLDSLLKFTQPDALKWMKGVNP